jgi:hypothetical protein
VGRGPTRTATEAAETRGEGCWRCAARAATRQPRQLPLTFVVAVHGGRLIPRGLNRSPCTATMHLCASHAIQSPVCLALGGLAFRGRPSSRTGQIFRISRRSSCAQRARALVSIVAEVPQACKVSTKGWITRNCVTRVERSLPRRATTTQKALHTTIRGTGELVSCEALSAERLALIQGRGQSPSLRWVCAAACPLSDSDGSVRQTALLKRNAFAVTSRGRGTAGGHSDRGVSTGRALAPTNKRGGLWNQPFARLLALIASALGKGNARKSPPLSLVLAPSSSLDRPSGRLSFPLPFQTDAGS